MALAAAATAGGFASSRAAADTFASVPALRIVSQYKGVWDALPTKIDETKTPDAPVLGNGDAGAIIAGNIDHQTFILGKNEFWSQTEGKIKAMSRLNLAVSDMTEAKYHAELNIAAAEVDGTFTLGGSTVTTKSWMQATDTTHNLLLTKLTYAGNGPRTVTISHEAGHENHFASTVGSAGPVLYIDVRGDPTDQMAGRDTCRARIATRVVGATGSVRGDSLTFAIQPGGTCTIVTCIMSNFDDPRYQSQAVDHVGSQAPADVDLLLTRHHAWWNDFYSRSFVEIPDKLIEREFYASLYLMACESRAGEVGPALWGNWIMKNMGWDGDYTLNYNAESPFLFCSPANHVDLQESYDKIILDWQPYGRANAIAAGYRGLYYEGHIGPLPYGAASSVGHPGGSRIAHPFMSQKSDASFAAMPMIIRYYQTRDLPYARTVYGYLKGVAAWWQSYLVREGDRFVDYEDAIFENETYPQTNCTVSLGFIRYVLQACLDMSTELEVDAASRPAWQEIMAKLSDYPTYARNGQTIFRCTEVGRDFKVSPKVLENAYPGAQIAAGSSPALIRIAQDTFTQLDCWTEGHLCLTYPTAARIGYDPAAILSHLDSLITSHAYNNLAISSGGGGIENVNVVPATICEMLLQSCQGTLRLFNDWPAGTPAAFGDLRADGAFLISSRKSGEAVEYVRLISEKGRAARFRNPWPGQSVQVYRNGVDAGTVSGPAFSLATSVNETLHLAPAGTSYAAILRQMNGG